MRRAYIMLLACMLIMQMPKIFAQSNSSALIPIPNSIEYCADGNTFKFNVKSVIKSNLHENTFIIKELKKVLATRLGLEFSINNSYRHSAWKGFLSQCASLGHRSGVAEAR